MATSKNWNPLVVLASGTTVVVPGGFNSAHLTNLGAVDAVITIVETSQTFTVLSKDSISLPDLNDGYFEKNRRWGSLSMNGTGTIVQCLCY
jgi:hypothetical protein